MQLVEQTDGVEAIFVSDDGTITCSSGINRDDSIQFHLIPDFRVLKNSA